jgi:DNA-binding NarL/FixJ family response regulator
MDVRWKLPRSAVYRYVARNAKQPANRNNCLYRHCKFQRNSRIVDLAMPTRFLVIEDHALVREGLSLALARVTERVEVVEADSCEAAVVILTAKSPFDMILLDMNLPGLSRMDALREICRHAAHTPIVVLSADASSELVHSAIHGGARGYIHKGAATEVLLGALQLVFSGGVYVPAVVVAPLQQTENDVALTKRQQQVLLELSRGASTVDIARTLDIAEVTVRVHLATILRVLRVESREQAVKTPLALRLLATADSKRV